MAKRKSKPKVEKVDGLGPDDLKRIHRAVRQVWQWSHAWRLAKKRAMHEDGFPRCENKKCLKFGKPVPKVSVDHIENVGQVGGPNYIQRMFIPSSQLQCLCKKCHDVKTNEERKMNDRNTDQNKFNGVKSKQPKKRKSFTDAF